MPILNLSDDQLDQVLRAARPLPVRDRDAFLQAIADGLRGKTIGYGEVFRASVKRCACFTMRRSLIPYPGVDPALASTPRRAS